MDPKKVYRRLYKHFGPQGWWPIGGLPVIPMKMGIQSKSSGSPVKPGMTDKKRFEIMVGAILTQNTAWRNVEKALANLRAAQALTPGAIVRMPIGRLQKLIRPAGYFRQKAKKLKILSRWIQKTGLDKITRSSKNVKSTDLLRHELLDLWGIGPETADSILLYSFSRPVFVVDAYTRRLCAAHGVRFKTYDKYSEYFKSHLAHLATSANIVYIYQEFHALIVAWGKKYGRPARKSE